MSNSNIEAVRKRLINRKEELENLLSQMHKEHVAINQVQDTGDQAFSSNFEELKIALQDNEFDEYRMILKALKMIDEGTYGICIDCGKSIAEKRLLMFPNSTRCLMCQEALEEQIIS